MKPLQWVGVVLIATGIANMVAASLQQSASVSPGVANAVATVGNIIPVSGIVQLAAGAALFFFGK